MMAILIFLDVLIVLGVSICPGCILVVLGVSICPECILVVLGVPVVVMCVSWQSYEYLLFYVCIVDVLVVLCV